MLAPWGRPSWVPDAGTQIMEWWTRLRAPKQEQRDLWTAITLVFWCIWRHRNNVVFNGERPAVETTWQMIRTEYVAWRAARLFRGERFGFQEPIPNGWIDGD